MVDEKFKIGDLVRLKSDNMDNVAMVVGDYLKKESNYKEAVRMGLLSDAELKSVKCVWRDKNDIPCEQYYPEDGLYLVE